MYTHKHEDKHKNTQRKQQQNKIDELETSLGEETSKRDLINVILDKVRENKLNWHLESGEINHLIFNSWYWNKTLISTLIAFLIFLVAYLIRIKRYELGSTLPKLPS